MSAPYRIIAGQPAGPATFVGLGLAEALLKAAQLRGGGWPFVIISEADGELVEQSQLQGLADRLRPRN